MTSTSPVTPGSIATTERDRLDTHGYRRVKGRYRADTPPKRGPRALDRLLRRTPRAGQP